MKSYMIDRLAPWVGAVALGIFIVAAWQRGMPRPAPDRAPQVVVPAVVQVVLYGGDRFLAASVESVRAAASGRDVDAREGTYRLRAHRVVAQLNPCHEDNYWTGNAALSFGGATERGTELLERAIRCRFWDELPPFFYGFNQKFFYSNIEKARQAMEIAAERSSVNAAGFRQIGIMFTVNALKDAEAALAMLEFERNNARDPMLRRLLEARITRVQGLLALRQAHRKFEGRFGKRLYDPIQLVHSGILQALPKDPLGLGYELHNGEFRMRQLQVEGVQ